MTTRENEPMSESLSDDRAATSVDESRDMGREASPADQSAGAARATDSADGTTSADRTANTDRTTSADQATNPAARSTMESDSSRNMSDEEPLVPGDAVVDFRARWEIIQQGFIDDPRSAVTDADTLVGDLLARLSSTFDQQHQGLERQWSDGEPSTEDLRAALQRYRSFFQRLLTI
jgi:hypothetical protein